jgi:hypothetical protein
MREQVIDPLGVGVSGKSRNINVIEASHNILPR